MTIEPMKTKKARELVHPIFMDDLGSDSLYEVTVLEKGIEGWEELWTFDIAARRGSHAKELAVKLAARDFGPGTYRCRARCCMR